MRLQSTTATLDGPVLFTASVIWNGPASNASDDGVALLLATATLIVQISTATVITEVPIDVPKVTEITATLDGPVLFTASVISDGPAINASDDEVALSLATATLNVQISTATAITEVPIDVTKLTETTATLDGPTSTVIASDDEDILAINSEKNKVQSPRKLLTVPNELSDLWVK